MCYKVCALLDGGGYAEKVAVHHWQIVPVPRNCSMEDAATFPEAACTVWSTVFMMGHLTLQSDHSILVRFYCLNCIII